jgi:hypothetical protein
MLTKHGYNDKSEVDHTTKGERIAALVRPNTAMVSGKVEECHFPSLRRAEEPYRTSQGGCGWDRHHPPPMFGLSCNPSKGWPTRVFSMTRTWLGHCPSNMRYARDDQVPYSHILIDEDGVGGGVVDQLQAIGRSPDTGDTFIMPMWFASNKRYDCGRDGREHHTHLRSNLG